MAMPNEIVFARHGQSEANIVQKRDDHGVDDEVTRQIFARPDWMNRLSSEGIDQAQRAKEWIDANLGGVASYDALYVSPFMRTRETAAYMGGLETKGWTIDDRIVERSWGVFGKLPRALQREQFPLTAEEKKLNPWYTRLDGGESMPDVYGRFRDFQGTLHREQAGKRVFVVTHGDFINVARYGIERMTPEEWEDMDGDEKYRITNCMLLQYSRVNPCTGAVDSKMRWRRYINPLDVAASPDSGEWVELRARRRYTGAELIRQAERAPRLLEGIEGVSRIG